MTNYSIGDLATRSGVKVPTIRYYEEIELIAPTGRTAGNQRRYDSDALDRLRFIAHARAMGFSMESLKSMLRIANHRDAPCEDLDALVEARLKEVDERLAKLIALRTELASMLESCAHGTVADCRILQVLSDHEECRAEH
ncbi:MerR family transcriptional regulator [Arsenicitalea aurantiaca]|uniref:MerR family transcriptional regulator n=1 Tax=Arsenicitalea aurantiaca TaxID=1783274 RepID=A0A433X3Z3_9HYPH|nr:helix-turn-helix domain-containing protein [Arsenicitalea aurantiaca]RUT28785.1 MerR family transcriptional regulator [Arsenicitalea aurantiaca]